MSNRVNISKGKVGRSVLGSYEKISGLAGYFGAVGSGKTTLAEGEYALLAAATDMAAYGISEAANPLLYHHISEYFRIGGKGAQLYVLNVRKVENAGFAELVADKSVQRMIAGTDGKIFNLGFAYVPADASAVVDGLPAEIVPAIRAAQKLADWTQQTNLYTLPLNVRDSAM